MVEPDRESPNRNQFVHLAPTSTRDGIRADFEALVPMASGSPMLPDCYCSGGGMNPEVNRRGRACVSADEAFAVLGIGRNTGYRAIREGTFPLPVIRIGRLIRIPKSALLRMLESDIEQAEHTE